MIGPVIAGVAIANIGLPACFYLNAVSFVAVLIALSKISTSGEARIPSQSVFRELIEGLQFMRNKPDIYRIIIMIAVFSLLAMPFVTLLPAFAVEVLRTGSAGFGFLVGATGAGALSAALFLALRTDIVEKNKFMAIASFCISLPLLAFSMSENFYYSLIALFFIGWGLVSFLATANSFIQLSVPDNLRGRAMSVYAFVFLGTAPLGNSLMGTVADLIGTAHSITISALVCIAVSVVFCVKICRS
jgi:MFS family permease